MSDPQSSDNKPPFLDLYKEFRVEMKHQETQRAAVSAAFITIAGAIIGLIFHAEPYSQVANPSQKNQYLGLLLLNFGFTASLILRKYYERFALGRERAQVFLRKLSFAHEPSGNAGERREWEQRTSSIKKSWDYGRDQNEEIYRFISFVRLHHLWESLIIGACLIGIVAQSPKGPNLTTHNGWLWYPAGPAVQILILFVVQRWQRYKEFWRRNRKGHKANEHFKLRQHLSVLPTRWFWSPLASFQEHWKTSKQA